MNQLEVPFYDLIVAINCYITTSERLGEGRGIISGDRLTVPIMVNTAHPVDVADFRAFLSRVEELEPEFELYWEDLEIRANFVVWGLVVELARVAAFAHALRSRPGPRGWGSQYESAIALGPTGATRTWAPHLA